MAKFRTGLEIEDRLKTILERIGCSLTEDPDLDHAWKIDFVITRFPQIPSIFAMGIQVTGRTDDLAKLEEFLRIHQYNRIAEKVMYVEFDKFADLDKGGGFAAFAAMLDYRLNTYWRNTPIIGVRINNDLSITTFNLQERIAELKRRLSHPQHPVQPHRTHEPRVSQPRLESSPASSQRQPVKPAAPVAEKAASMEAEKKEVKVAAATASSGEAEAVATTSEAEKKPRRRRSRSSRKPE